MTKTENMERVMPKLKTHKGAAKRFRMTATGKIKRGHSHARHILTKKEQQAENDCWTLTGWFQNRTRSESKRCCRTEETNRANYEV